MLLLLLIETMIATVISFIVFKIEYPTGDFNKIWAILNNQIFCSVTRVIFFYPIWIPASFLILSKSKRIKFGVLYNSLSYILLSLLFSLLIPETREYLIFKFDYNWGYFYYTTVATLLSPLILWEKILTGLLNKPMPSDTSGSSNKSN